MNTEVQAEPAQPLASEPPPKKPPASLNRRVFNMAWPIISENLLQTMLGVVDTIMVGYLGAAALAGVSAAVQVMFFVISALGAIAVGSSVLVAQAFGRQNYTQAGHFAKQSLIWSTVISIPLVLVGLFAADTIFLVFGLEPEVNAMGIAYLQVTMGTVLVLTLQILIGGVMRGAGDSRTPMLVTLLANVVNIIVSYGLIFGRLGMPELGMIGSAWGSLVARLLSVLLLLYFMWRGFNGIHIRGWLGWRPDFGIAQALLRIGVPAAVEQVLNSVAFLLLSIVIARLGTVVLAAHQVGLHAFTISFLPGFGFAMAATALVGQSVGAQRYDEAQGVARIAGKWALVWMCPFGLVFFFFGETLIRIFTNDPGVITHATAGLMAVAFTQPFFAIGMVMSGALRGTGETRYPMWVNILTIWGAVTIGAVIAYFGGHNLGLVWSGFLFTSPFSAYFIWRRWRQMITGLQVASTPIPLESQPELAAGQVTS
jgi:multidrug resistance protein, MATE family